MDDEILRVPSAHPQYYFDVRIHSKDDLLVLREIWSENVYEIFDGDMAEEPHTVVDIGANIGAFSVYVAHLGAKRVIAVEPEPHNLELLKANIAINRELTSDTTYVIEERAIGGERKRDYISNEHGGSRINPSDGTLVDIITLEDLWNQHRLEYVNVLKLDVEGSEGQILLNTPKHILQYCRYIVLEYDEHANDLGAIVEKLCQTHQIKYVGENGGMLYSRRY